MSKFCIEEITMGFAYSNSVMILKKGDNYES